MECPICLHTIHRRINIPECSKKHWMCSECSSSLLKINAKCPFCRESWFPSNSMFFAPSKQTFSCCLLDLLMETVDKLGIFDSVFDDSEISPTIDSIHTVLEMKDGVKMTLLQYAIYENDLVEYPVCEKCELLNFHQFCEFYKTLYQVKANCQDCPDWTKIEIPSDLDVTLSKMYQPIAEKIQGKELAENREYLICCKINKICLNKGQIDVDELYYLLLKQLCSNCPTQNEFEKFVALMCEKNYIERNGNQILYVY
jgi:hypothetical protein